MKLQIFSDLHCDVAPTKHIAIADGVDAVIIAGDTCEGAVKAFDHLRRIVPIAIPVIMVMGNHEYYRSFVPTELRLARDNATAFNIHLLENDSVMLGGIRFVGTTLWTDYRIFGDANAAAAISACADGMNDHRRIGWQKQPWLRFRPQEAALLHNRSKNYLAEVLAMPSQEPTVVVSHHAVSWQSVDLKLQNDRLTAAYVSDLSAFIGAYQPTLWIHGHIHRSSDYLVGATRVLCNPHGYGRENPDFNGELIVEVGN
jgi:Icc-related predicted phosphoesterase